MNQSNSANQGNANSNVGSLGALITSYEIAVLSTLFDQEDLNKVGDLAKQWGYQQDFLYSVWQKIHADLVDY